CLAANGNAVAVIPSAIVAEFKLSLVSVLSFFVTKLGTSFLELDFTLSSVTSSVVFFLIVGSFFKALFFSSAALANFVADTVSFFCDSLDVEATVESAK